MNWISIIPSHSINQEKAGCSRTNTHTQRKYSADTHSHPVWPTNFSWSRGLILLVLWTKSDTKESTRAYTIYRCVRRCVCKPASFLPSRLWLKLLKTTYCVRILQNHWPRFHHRALQSLAGGSHYCNIQYLSTFLFLFSFPHLISCRDD